MISLAQGEWSARLLPSQGGAFARLAWRGIDVLRPLPDGADPNTGRAGAFLMLPWCNRLDGGRLGEAHRLPVNRPDENTAIHGLARDRPFKVVDSGPDNAVLEQRLEDAALPYRYTARQVVTLRESGLLLELALTNTGSAPMPFGLGWHPWFARPAGTRIAFRAGTRLLGDTRVMPKDAVPSTGMDGEASAALGLDGHFVGWDGIARITQPQAAVTLRASGAWARNLHVYVPEGLDAICVEPVSHVPDVVNRRAFTRHGDMALLSPGETLSASLLLGAA